MTELDTQEILKIVEKNLTDNEKGKAVIYWNMNLLDAGQTIKIGRKKLAMPFEGYLVFIDLEPQANWGHPAVYLLIDAETHKTQKVQEEYPPFSGDPPQNFKLIEKNLF
jgi:hypothetical protein